MTDFICPRWVRYLAIGLVIAYAILFYIVVTGEIT